MPFSYSRLMLLSLAAVPVITGALVSVGGQNGEQSVKKFLPDPLPVNQAPLSLPNLEAMLERVPLDDSNALIVDERTTVALNTGVEDLPPDLSEAEQNRVRFLIRKGLPGPAGEPLADLLFRYFQYQQAQARLGIGEEASVSTDAFEQLVQLQARYFGQEKAQRLFRQRNAMRRAILEASQNDGKRPNEP